MIPLIIAAAATAAAANSKNQSDAATRDLQERGMKALENIPLPVLKELHPELYAQVVKLNPELETGINLGPSAMEGISTNPAERAAQLNALSKLQDIGNSGGMQLSDKASLNDIMNQSNANLRGNEQAIQMNMATRGMSGSGMDAVAQQLSAQNASNQASQQGLSVTAQAQQRALDAIMRSGQLGGQMQSQDFNQQATKANAMDAISKFNTQNQQNVLSQNVQAKNQAQQWNANQAQNIANQNVGLNNDAQKYNNNLPQQNFNNQVTKAGGQVAQGNAMANTAAQQGASNLGFYGNVLGAGANAYGSYVGNKKKQDEEQ